MRFLAPLRADASAVAFEIVKSRLRVSFSSGCRLLVKTDHGFRHPRIWVCGWGQGLAMAKGGGKGASPATQMQTPHSGTPRRPRKAATIKLSHGGSRKRTPHSPRRDCRSSPRPPQSRRRRLAAPRTWPMGPKCCRERCGRTISLLSCDSSWTMRSRSAFP